jgi:hypothetical protein
MQLNLVMSALFLTVVAAAVGNGVHAQQPGPIPAPPDVKAPPADASRTASGLASKVIKPGTGTAHPGATSTVTVHYSGWTTDGQVFDS